MRAMSLVAFAQAEAALTQGYMLSAFFATATLIPGKKHVSFGHRGFHVDLLHIDPPRQDRESSRP